MDATALGTIQSPLKPAKAKLHDSMNHMITCLKFVHNHPKKSASGIHDASVQKAIYIMVPFHSRHIWSTLTINNTLLGKS